MASKRTVKPGTKIEESYKETSIELLKSQTRLDEVRKILKLQTAAEKCITGPTNPTYAYPSTDYLAPQERSNTPSGSTPPRSAITRDSGFHESSNSSGRQAEEVPSLADSQSGGQRPISPGDSEFKSPKIDQTSRKAIQSPCSEGPSQNDGPIDQEYIQDGKSEKMKSQSPTSNRLRLHGQHRLKLSAGTGRRPSWQDERTQLLDVKEDRILEEDDIEDTVDNVRLPTMVPLDNDAKSVAVTVLTKERRSSIVSIGEELPPIKSRLPTNRTVSSHSDVPSDGKDEVPQDVFEGIPPGLNTKTVNQQKLKQAETMGKIKRLLRPIVFRRDAPWINSWLLMGCDEDYKFKVWVPHQYKDIVKSAIETELTKRRMFSKYGRLITVTGLDEKEGFDLQREAGIKLLTGMQIILSNGSRVRLTAFFRCGGNIYALTTSHLAPLVAQKVHYETRAGALVELGKIIIHVCESSPFMEACLVKVNSDQERNVCEYITDHTAQQHPARCIHSVYMGAIDMLPAYRPFGLMNIDQGTYRLITSRGLMDIRDGTRNLTLEDAVVWTSPEDIGQPGTSGASILGRSHDEQFELLAMYIGRLRLNNRTMLVSHAVKSTIEYFGQFLPANLQIYNPSNVISGQGNNSADNQAAAGNHVGQNQVLFGAFPNPQLPSTIVSSSSSRGAFERDMKPGSLPKRKSLPNKKKSVKNQARPQVEKRHGLDGLLQVANGLKFSRP